MNGLAWYMGALTPKIVAFCHYQGEEILPARSLSILWYKIKATEIVADIAAQNRDSNEMSILL